MASLASPRFFSVPARFSGRVVCRVHSRGSVWAWRAPRSGDRPSPACLFLPACHQGRAQAFAVCAGHLGWPAEVKPGSACAVWRSGPLASSAPAWACKVRLPSGLSASVARAQLRAAWLRLTW
jgi:hypothetical protein